jgi:O-antigen biosynthesis protein
MNPLVSVIVRTKDRPHLLRSALESVVHQDYRPVEIVLVNDGGKELPIDDLRRLLEDVTLLHVRLPFSMGRAGAGNAGIRLFKGEYAGFLDDDDEYSPDHLSTLIAFLQEKRFGVAYADSELVVREADPEKGESREVERRLFSSYDFSMSDLLTGNYISLISILFSRAALLESGGFDEQFELYEDWDLLLRIGEKHPFGHVKKITSFYHQWSTRDQIAQKAGARVTEEAYLKVLQKHREKLTGEVVLKLKNKESILTARFKDLIENYRRMEEELVRRGCEFSEKERASAEKVASLSDKILHMEQQQLQKDHELLGMRNRLLQKENQLQEVSDSLNRRIDLLTAQIGEIEATLGWRLLVRIRTARDAILPPETGRGRMYRKAVGLLKGEREGDEPVDAQEVPSEAASGQEAEHVEEDLYALWIAESEPDSAVLAQQKVESRNLARRPLVSLVVPVYETENRMLVSMIESVIAQTYENWQLCIADGNSSLPHVRETLKMYSEKDSRICVKYLDENRHISGNSNEALSMAEGEFVGFIDHDDELAPFALFEVVKLINEDSSVDFIYSDEDKIDVDGRRSSPFFKPDWSPDLLCSVNYICHFTVMRKSLFSQAGMFRSTFDGAQDYDLFLRASLATPRISHVPKVLYHWREHGSSTCGDVSRKEYADVAGKAALEDFLKRSEVDAEVVSSEAMTNYIVRYRIRGRPLVSIVIPFRDKVDLLEKCLGGILGKTVYPHFEVLLVSNRSSEEETFLFLDEARRDERVKVLTFDEDFNYSRINNEAARHASGEFLLFLNNDTEVISAEWLTYLLEHAQRPEIGVVGCKLLYPDGRIQHAGVVLGMTGLAGHVFAGLPDHAYTCFGSVDFLRNVTAVTGACMMMKKSLFDSLGGFDESFVICGSDVELCLRAGRAGVRNLYVPYSALYHHESVSRGSYIPESDFRLSMKSYANVLKDGDPYYSQNLSLVRTDCVPRLKKEAQILQEIIDNALKKEQVKSGDFKGFAPVYRNETTDLIEALDFSSKDLQESRAMMAEFEKTPPLIRSINWFIPYFHHVYYGGIHTILRFADYFSKKGIRSRFVLYDGPDVPPAEILGKVRKAFPGLDGEVFVRLDPDVNTIPYADISVATLWTSAYRLLRFKKTKGKFYFIQDYEPLFYPAGSWYALAEATYRFGFHGLINTPGLHEFVTRKHDMKAEFFMPAVDKNVFFPEERQKNRKSFKLFFYGRPRHDRNAFDLAITAVRKIKAVLGDKIEIVSAGSDWSPSEYGLQGIAENLGLMEYGATAELYRTCDFGLVLMFTKHPSYLPLELMACGAIVVTNSNRTNEWLLRDKVNCITIEPAPTYVAEAVALLVQDETLRSYIRENALKTASSFEWEPEMEKIFRFMRGNSSATGQAAIETEPTPFGKTTGMPGRGNV